MNNLEAKFINSTTDDLLVVLHTTLDDGDNEDPKVFAAINELVERAHLRLLSPNQTKALGFYSRVAMGAF